MRSARTRSPTSVSTIVLGPLVSSHLSTWCCVMTPLCLPEGDGPLSDEDQLFDDVRRATKDMRSDWYSLAIQLDIDYGTRKVSSVCFVV